ncbi:chaperone protein dnaJ C76, chloroplastic-like [Triticum dicoccoides]|uniref:chaperone protein dnaJ C76, chloroplastic-like n=1 Tax=Triticum dicoccoides TaxID=85692 RepID=UPI00188F52BE|nr:chaperone protein dnaJ C76, chloroplastic-like [Triticum dicoccoides]
MPALLLNTAAPLANPSSLRPSFGSSRHQHRCRAAASSSSSSSSSSGRAGSSWATDYDLYELLGVEPSSPQADIKAAYRALQKRCHPDVAANGGNGPSAHDMAVVLNEVYALLSDPAQRRAYDREHARRSEFQGYTGRPLYSSWRGGDAETRAVFVDEVACVGCLKCALHAGRTFAIESVHGRARVVAQWADPEDRIADAVQTCPVDCISYVDRSDLAALEFLMSKLPRRRVRVSEANAAGSPDIFAEVAKFKARFDKMENKSATRQSEESEATWQSRSSAVQTIMSMSNWWYWRPFRAPAGAATAAVPAPLRLLPPPQSPPPPSAAADPVTERLKEAAARRKAEGATASAVYARQRDEYWTPQRNLPSTASFPSPEAQSAAPPRRRVRRASGGERPAERRARIDLTVPMLMAIVAAGIAGYNREEMGGGVIEDHIGGEAALGVVNSSELQVVLAGVTWFVIGAAVAGFLQVALGRRNE